MSGVNRLFGLPTLTCPLGFRDRVSGARLRVSEETAGSYISYCRIVSAYLVSFSWVVFRWLVVSRNGELNLRLPRLNGWATLLVDIDVRTALVFQL